MKMPFEGSYPITQEFGNDLVLNGVHIYQQWNMLGHNGMDYGVPLGTDILAPIHGTVIEAQYDEGGYGNYVKIENEAEGSTLAHLENLSVRKGDVIEEGKLIGHSGNTGNSTGPHLHWGYYKIPRNRGNGYDGYIDQAPILESLGLLSNVSAVGGLTYATTIDNLPDNTPVPLNVISKEPDYYPSAESDWKVDLNNKESIKVCVDTWHEVVSGGFVRAADAEKEAIESRLILAESLDKEKRAIEAERDNYKAQVESYQSHPNNNEELNNVSTALTELQKKYQILEGEYQAFKDEVANRPQENVALPENMVDKSLLDEAKQMINDLQLVNGDLALKLDASVKQVKATEKLIKVLKYDIPELRQSKDPSKVLKTIGDVLSIVSNLHLMFVATKKEGEAKPSVMDDTMKALEA